MDFKKNIFWIVLGVVVVAGVGVYFWTISSLATSDGKTVDALQTDCLSKVENLKKMASKPESIVNPTQVSMAKDYKKAVEEQAQYVETAWKSKNLDLRFQNVPNDPLAFDNWLSEQRTKLADQCQKAGLQLPPEFEKIMFKEPSTSEASEDPSRHRNYRLRQIALMDEVLGVLCKKYGKRQVLKFAPEKDGQEPRESVDVGAVALEKFTLVPSRDLLSKAGGLSAEDRAKSTVDEALKRAGFRGGVKGTPAADLPISITSIDLQILAPLQSIPGIIQALESSNRYTGVITRVDYQRAVNPFPAATDFAKTGAGPVPTANTHYQEGPIRALISFDIYEFSAAKEAAAAKAAAEPPKADPKKKGK